MLNMILANPLRRFSGMAPPSPAFLLGLILLVGMNLGALAEPDMWRNQGWGETDFSKTSVKFEEILGGGPPKDGIPSIDTPSFLSLAETDSAELGLGPLEPVVTLVINGDARAYPLRVLMWHEIVNDTVGGLPVAITFCPLCNTALVFERQIDDVLYDFGTTGLLRFSNLIMYDRQTQSWWLQYSGEAIVGTELGAVLKGVPARLESFERFVAAHPKGRVLVPNNPNIRSYGTNPYVGYDLSARPFLFRGDLPTDIEPMARVVMVEADGKTQAISLAHLRKVRKVELGDVVVTWEKGRNSSLETREISKGRDVGNVIARRRTATGFEDIVNHLTFAFAYRAFEPGGPILQE